MKFLLCALSLLTALPSQGQSDAAIRVRPVSEPLPAYKGIVLGKTRAADLIKRFGTPVWIDESPEDKEVAYGYMPKAGGEEFIARLDWSTKTVFEVNVYPDGLDVRGAVRQFGSDYRRVRYDFDDCLDVGGEAPIYESSDGNVEFLEYRHKGIYVRISGSQVEEIRYARKPPGTPKSRCPQHR